MRMPFKRFKAWLFRRLLTPESAATHERSIDAANKIDHRQSHQDHDIQQIVPYDENLLERARTQWQFGDWASLTGITRDTLKHHPDRAKLALLVSVGHQGLGNATEARQYAQLSIGWGCSKGVVSHLLISSVHNTLGRGAAITGNRDRSHKHFAQAIRIGLPGSETQHTTQARMGEQLGQLGLSAGRTGRLQAIQTAALQANEICVTPVLQDNPVFGAKAFTFYQGLATNSKEQNDPKFILLDSKSLPRAGLHYMKKTFAKLLGDDFSFCEWYQEPGCCKKMPCAITGYATHCEKTKRSKLRLIKSHDFDLSDPAYETSTNVRRVILVRDPLFILTSWFALDQLHAHKESLAAAGINIEKIWLLHEPAVLASAYQTIDASFVPPSKEALNAWLSKQSLYIAGFHRRWVKPTIENPQPYTTVVDYKDVNTFIGNICTELQEHLPMEATNHISKHVLSKKQDFIARSTPFEVESRQVTAYMQEHSDAFIQIATALNWNRN